MSNNDNERTYKSFNTQKYYIEVKMWNPDGYSLTLNPQAIMHMVIEDDLHFWPVRGFLVYENPFEIIERKFVSDQDIKNTYGDSQTSTDLLGVKAYIFRNDGRDYLDITIKPEVSQTPNEDLSVTTLPDEPWKLEYHCVIYDKEDIDVNNLTQKLKKFYFWDVDYQKMLDQKIEWSTATSDQNPTKRQKGNNYIPSLATDEERMMYTGTAIKDILDSNKFYTSDDIFDKGSTQIFNTNYNDRNIWENVNYLLQHHMSEKTKADTTEEVDVCVFSKNRYTGYFELEPLHSIFKKAGYQSNDPKEYQIEHLMMEDIGDVTTSISPFKSPVLDKLDATKDVKINKLKKYQFVDMSAGDSTNEMVTTPVYSYDFKTKTFSLNIADSNVITLTDKLNKIYIENKLLSVNGTHPLLTLNNMKTNNTSIHPIYSVHSEKPIILRKGLGRLLYSGLFLNECLSFQLEGATIRKSGRFIAIDRQTNSDNTLDYKLCGQWFITGVKHVFFHNMYLNEMVAVKMHTYDDLNLMTEVD